MTKKYYSSPYNMHASIANPYLLALAQYLVICVVNIENVTSNLV